MHKTFLKSFGWAEVHFVGPLLPSVSDLDDSAQGFQSQGGFTVTCALLLLVHNNPESHLWLPGPSSDRSSVR